MENVLVYISEKKFSYLEISQILYSILRKYLSRLFLLAYELLFLLTNVRSFQLLLYLEEYI